MKPNWFSVTRLVCAAAMFFLLAGASARAASGDLKLEMQLVLGSNDAKPKDAGLKPVARDIEKKLKHLPLKWDHYYVVSHKKFTVAADHGRNITLSKDCQVSVKNLGGSRVELTLMNQSQTVGRITQSLHKGRTLVAGGGAENTIVVLWQAN
jgi:hypothetical protein